MTRDKNVASYCWDLCVELQLTTGSTQRISEPLFAGLCHLMHFMKKHGLDMKHDRYRSVLVASGINSANESIQKAVLYHGKGGVRVWAQGLSILLNKRKRSSTRIPSVLDE